MKKIENILFEELKRIKSLLGEDGITQKGINESEVFSRNADGTQKFPTGTFSVEKMLNSMPQGAERDAYLRNKFITDPCTATEYGVQSFYRQKPIDAPGYYSDFKLGECSAVEYFGQNESAIYAMDIRSDVYQDDNGYFIKVGGSGNKEMQVSLYLPSDEFFKQMTGKVKSFLAFDSCKTACKFKKGESLDKDDKKERFVLLYQLRDPSKAMNSILYGPEGAVPTDLDPLDRGWDLVTANIMESGYFSVNPDNIMSAMKEYTSDEYNSNFGKSEFDQWYDSGWGTFGQIALAVFIGIITGAAAAPFIAMIEAQATRIAVNLAVQTGAELLVAIPEAIYLTGRGMNTNAAFVLVLAMIPLVQGKIVGGTALDPTTYGHVHECMRRYGNGEFKTPADLKRYFKSLPDGGVAIQKIFKDTSTALAENGGRLMESEIAAAMNKLIKEIPKGVESLGFKIGAMETYQQIAKYIPSKSQQLFKVAKIGGVTVLASFAVHPILAFFIKDADWVKNPQKLPPAEETAMKLGAVLMEKKVSPLNQKMEKLREELQVAIVNQDTRKAAQITVELVRIIDDLVLISAMPNSPLVDIKKQTKSEVIAGMLSAIENQIRTEMKASNNTESATATRAISAGITASQDSIFMDQTKECQSQTNIQVQKGYTINWETPTEKDKKINCNFRTWVIDKFNLTKNDLVACGDWKTLKPPDKFLYSDCKFKKYWNGKDSSGKLYLSLWLEDIRKSKKV